MSVRKLLVLCIAFIVFTAAASVGGPLVRLKYAEFDPLAGEPTVPPGLCAAPVSNEAECYIVQFTGPIEESWKADLQKLGAELLDYIPEFSFIVRMTPEAAAKARAYPQVRWVGLYHGAYRLERALLGKSGLARVNMVTLPGEARATAEAAVLRTGGKLHSSAAGPLGAQMDATVSASDLRRPANLKNVVWVERRLEHKLLNNVARGLMNVPPVWSGAGLYGAGEIVAVCDTGLDTGSQATLSADFAGRILKTYTLGRKGKWDDPDGHGTHVAGSVLGSGVLSGSDPASHSYANSFAGTAPEAQLVFQSILDSFGTLRGIPADLNQLFQRPYSDGARIHTNSWGSSDSSGAYTTDSRNVDLFAWNNRDMTILFAAGNEGIDSNSDGVVDAGSMISPGTAKNCITVGASESHRLSGGAQGTYGNYWAGDYPASPIFVDRLSDDPSGIVAFSSRGPTADGRIKPDVVAPGTNIISCASHVIGAGSLWGRYDPDYSYCGGTSMATPLTAGVAALIRQYYRTQLSHSPTSALVKATLVNGATDLYPGQYGVGSFQEIPRTRPNNVEGWGLVNPMSILPSSSRSLEFVDSTEGLSTGDTAVHSYPVAANAGPLHVTLAWTDYPASAAASKALVNDLDLVVVLPDGSILRGNGDIDRTNNLEGVSITDPLQGNYTIRVEGYNVPFGPQTYALVVSRPLESPAPTAVIDLPAQGTVLSGPVTVRGSASGTGFQRYELEYGVGASPADWMPVGSPSTVPVVNGVLGTWDTRQLVEGAYTLRLTSTGVGGSSTAQVTASVLRTGISSVKNRPDGSAVTLTGKIVSAGTADLAGMLYVQEPGRTAGIRIVPASPLSAIVPGDMVTVTGSLQTLDGERAVANAQVVVTGAASSP